MMMRRNLPYHESSRERSPLRNRELDINTTDPGKADARIFVRGFTTNMTREMLHKHFSKWGEVTGISITKNMLCFIQFRSSADALACLASGYQTYINGERLDIEPSRESLSSRYELGKGGWDDTVGQYPTERHTTYRSVDRVTPRDSYYDSFYGSKLRGREVDYLDSKLRGREVDYLDRYKISYRGSDYYSRSDSLRDNEDDGYYRSSDHNIDTSYGKSSFDSYSLSSDYKDPLDPSRPNDVEIVVPHKMQRVYAENIEARLKEFGLLVDLLFPPPDVTSEKVIKDLTARRCLYAIFTTAENEKHNSLTINILQDDPQEHRNIPVDDGMQLLEKHFEDYMKKVRLRNKREVVPRDIRNLLLDLLEMRPLSMGDLDKLIKYLRERQNALVDDQIEQKRENAGQKHQQPSVVAAARTMAVTYPGYNYIASNVQAPVSVSVASSAGHAAAVLSAGSHAAVPAGSVNIVSAPSVSAAAAYSVYSGMQGLQPPPPPTINTAHVQATGLQPTANLSAHNLMASFGISPTTQYTSIPAPPTAPPAPAPPPPPPTLTNPNKQTEMQLQERILNLMKASSTLGASAAPTGVPAPPTARLMQQQPPVWMRNQQQQRSNDVSKVGHSTDTAYNPWSQ